MKLKSIQEYIDDIESQFYIIIKLNLDSAIRLNLQLNEGQWVPSSEKGFMQRVDKPHFSNDQLHVHIALNKHVNTKIKQVSWNADGTRHDKQKFNDNITGLERAKKAAKKALGLSSDSLLECLNIREEAILLLENINLPDTTDVYIFDLDGGKI